ncbi:hypothetical protein TNIN_286591 [Trichonephila inaurata madagascariensis]|uniref:Uncharacterized protein n=1 Tax=Trichonephila inaurata madagascariensis TaxID=2747483 RepID=A0A8X7CN78_9ARAC|nr:hypothetical protein TNIN_286591 [Trichonephila inaurata madagascariensis]
MTVLLSFHGTRKISELLSNAKSNMPLSFIRIDLDSSKGHSWFIRFSRIIPATRNPCSPRLFKRSMLVKCYQNIKSNLKGSQSSPLASPHPEFQEQYHFLHQILYRNREKKYSNIPRFLRVQSLYPKCIGLLG